MLISFLLIELIKTECPTGRNILLELNLTKHVGQNEIMNVYTCMLLYVLVLCGFSAYIVLGDPGNETASPTDGESLINPT